MRSIPGFLWTWGFVSLLVVAAGCSGDTGSSSKTALDPATNPPSDQAPPDDSSDKRAPSERTPIDLGSRLGTDLIVDTLTGAGDDLPYGAECGENPLTGGPDKVFQWKAPAEGDYWIDTSGSIGSPRIPSPPNWHGANTMLAVFEGSLQGKRLTSAPNPMGVGSPSWCNFYTSAAAFDAGFLLTNVKEGEVFAIVVDSEWPDGGDFKLSIHSMPLPTETSEADCKDQIDNDRDGLEDCRDPGCVASYSFCWG